MAKMNLYTLEDLNNQKKLLEIIYKQLLSALYDALADGPEDLLDHLSSVEHYIGEQLAELKWKIRFLEAC